MVRDGDGNVASRPVTFPRYDATIQIQPLRWGDAKALYQNQDRDLGMLAELFGLALPITTTAEDVARLPAGRADILERAILEASELLDEIEGGEGDDSDSNPQGEGGEDTPAEHSVMSGPAAADRARDSLNEHTEADLYYQLHEHGYTFQTAAQLLVPEIDTLMDGIERAQRRAEKKRDEADTNTSPGAQGGGMKGNRGGSHGDSLWQ